MSDLLMGGYSLYEALKAEGYTLPDECADIALSLPVDGVLQLILHVNLTDETLEMVGRAFVRMSHYNQASKRTRTERL